MEVNEELTLEVNPASVLARRASLNVGRSGSGLGLSSLATSGSNHDVSLLTQQLRQGMGVKLGAAEYADLLRAKWNKQENGEVPGYHGKWRFYKAASAEDADEEKRFMCVRTYAATPLSEDGVPEINICNIHNGSAAFGQPEQRPQDGLWQNTFHRLLSDPYFSVKRLFFHMHDVMHYKACSLMTLDELEEAEGLPAACFRRSVPIAGETLDVAARVPPALPPAHQQPGAVATGMWGAHAASGTKSPSAWGFEVLMEDGDNRWSMGPLYSMESLDAASHFFVQEYSCNLRLDDAIDLAGLPYKEPRPRLSVNTADWMPGKWTGQLVDIVWDEDGEMVECLLRVLLRLLEVLSSVQRLLLLPDGMYAYYPARLPAAEPDTAASFRNIIRFEVGGMMRSETLFRRIILRYSINGQIESISDEAYRPVE